MYILIKNNNVIINYSNNFFSSVHIYSFDRLSVMCGNIGYRILKLEDRTSPHKANLNDDYEYIQKFALNEKQNKIMDEWVNKSAKNTFIKVDDLYKYCSQKNKWNLSW